MRRHDVILRLSKDGHARRPLFPSDVEVAGSYLVGGA